MDQTKTKDRAKAWICWLLTQLGQGCQWASLWAKLIHSLIQPFTTGPWSTSKYIEIYEVVVFIWHLLFSCPKPFMAHQKICKLVGTLFSASGGTYLLFTSDWARLLNICDLLSQNEHKVARVIFWIYYRFQIFIKYALKWYMTCGYSFSFWSTTPNILGRFSFVFIVLLHT